MNPEGTESTKEESSKAIDYSSLDCEQKQVDTQTEMDITLSWLDYRQEEYCMSYSVLNSDYSLSRSNRNLYSEGYYTDYRQLWGELYQELYNDSKSKLTEVTNELRAIQIGKQLNHAEFANTIVSFVQDIPYSFILGDERCEDQEEQAFDCLEDEKFGILSPVEFLYTLRGDCDTRTVLLYTLLREFDYHPKIAISNEYAHSILLVDVISAGSDFISSFGVDYYFWETTATGWQAGILPPHCNDISKWDIVLN